jgi:hypothetical protein
MSLNIVKKNSSSPFHLQRSIVDQGGSGGAYESGGFNPDTVYNNDAANAAVESLGKVIGAGLSSRTAGDQNKDDLKTKERLDKKEKNIKDDSWKNAANDRTPQREKEQKKLDRIDRRQERVEGRITDYNKTQNPSLASTLVTNLGSVEAGKQVSASKKESENKSLLNIGSQLKTDYSSSANLKSPIKPSIFGPKENYTLGEGPKAGFVKKQLPKIGFRF